MVVDTLIVVPLDEGSRLAVVNVETLLNRLLVVVGTSALLAALHEARHELVLGNVEFYHGGNLVSALREHLLQSLCLRDGAGEAVENHALVFLAEGVVNAGEDVHHQVVGDELPLVDISLGGLAEVSAVLDFAAQHVARGDMPQAVLLDHEIALGALA